MVADDNTGHHGDGPYNDVDIPGCWFYKIPHKVRKLSSALCVIIYMFFSI